MMYLVTFKGWRRGKRWDVGHTIRCLSELRSMPYTGITHLTVMRIR